MTRVPQRQFNLIGESPQFQPSGASSAFGRELAIATQNIAEDMQSKADAIYVSEFLTSTRQNARGIYQRNIGNPEQLQKELFEYKKGLIKNTPSRLRARLENDYSSLTDKYIGKATEIRNKQLTAQQRIAQDAESNEIMNDMVFAARDLFTDDPDLTEDEIKARHLTAIDRLSVDFAALEQNLSKIGADGKLLRTPDQIASSVLKAREFLFAEAANSYIDSKPNKLEAYAEWLDNKVTVDLPEGSINVRDSMTPEVRKKTDAALIASIKNDMYMAKKAEEVVEKEQAVFQDETKKILFEKSITGTLTPAEVEASRSILDFEDFQDFSVMAREANPITNGVTYGQLINKLDKGMDISSDLTKARFADKSLSNEDYEKLSNRNIQKALVPEPVDAGRDFLLGFLGASSEALSITQSAVMAKAERDYDARINDFVERNQVQPGRDDAMQIADDVANRYNLIEMNNFAATLPKPKAMPISVKVKQSGLTHETLQQIKQDTFNLFVEKHKGDENAAVLDPEFAEEIKLLQRYEAIINNKVQK
jgi:hypothetical protein